MTYIKVTLCVPRLLFLLLKKFVYTFCVNRNNRFSSISIKSQILKPKTGKLLTYFYFRLNAGLYSINAFRQRPFTSVGTRSLIEPSGIQSALSFPTYRCTFLNISNIGSTVAETTDVSPGVGVVCAGEFLEWQPCIFLNGSVTVCNEKINLNLLNCAARIKNELKINQYIKENLTFLF